VRCHRLPCLAPDSFIDVGSGCAPACRLDLCNPSVQPSTGRLCCSAARRPARRFRLLLTLAHSTSFDRAHASSANRRVVLVAGAALTPRPQAVEEGDLAGMTQLHRALQPLAPRPRLARAVVPQEAVLRLQARLGYVKRVSQHGGDCAREKARDRSDPRRLVSGCFFYSCASARRRISG
jgi:hypothetical protein